MLFITKKLLAGMRMELGCGETEFFCGKDEFWG
jgi:hypothetical protein